MPDALSDLHRRKDGLLTEDEKRAAKGIDIRLANARAAAQFWRSQYNDAKKAYRTSTAGLERRMELVDSVVFARAELARAEARLAQLEPTSPGLGPGGFYKHIGSSI